MRKSSAVTTLVEALDDDSLPVRENAAQALGMIGDDRAVEPLIEKLGDLSSGIRSEAAQALGQIGNDLAVPQLIKIALDENLTVLQRVSAIEALGNIYHPDALFTLCSLINSPMKSIRSTVLKSLSQRTDLTANDNLITQLLRLWEHDDEQADLPLIADVLSLTCDPSIAPKILNGMDRLESVTARRTLLNCVGSLLTETGAFYPFLAFDRFEADAAISKSLTSILKVLKARRAGNERPLIRLTVRIRQALEAHVSGNHQAFVDRLSDSILLATPLAPSEYSEKQLDAICSVVIKLRERSTHVHLSSDENLLLVFLLQKLTS